MILSCLSRRSNGTLRMFGRTLALSFLLLPLASMIGCGGKTSTSVVAPADDAAARKAAEEAYDKETAAANQ